LSSIRIALTATFIRVYFNIKVTTTRTKVGNKLLLLSLLSSGQLAILCAPLKLLKRLMAIFTLTQNIYVYIYVYIGENSSFALPGQPGNAPGNATLTRQPSIYI